MEIVWGRVLPVVVSVVIIIGVAVLREYSRTLAAILVTMPINIPLGLWVVYSGDSDPAVMQQFIQALFINIWPTILFLAVVWWAAKAEWRIVPMLAAGYAAWAVGLAALLLAKRALGI